MFPPRHDEISLSRAQFPFDPTLPAAYPKLLPSHLHDIDYRSHLVYPKRNMMSGWITRVGRAWCEWSGAKIPDDVLLKTAILTDDLPALSHLLTPPSPPTLTPLHAFTLSAKLSRPVSFDYLLAHHPDLASSLRTDSLLLNALTGDCVPVWRIILAHEPGAKDHRFGHFGTVVERCVSWNMKELLRYLLGEGAKVEQWRGKPILLRAEIFEADEEIKEMLVRYGARTDFADEVESEGP